MGKAHMHNREKPSYYLFESHTEIHSFQLSIVFAHPQLLFEIVFEAAVASSNNFSD